MARRVACASAGSPALYADPFDSQPARGAGLRHAGLSLKHFGSPPFGDFYCAHLCCLAVIVYVLSVNCGCRTIKARISRHTMRTDRTSGRTVPGVATHRGRARLGHRFQRHQLPDSKRNDHPASRTPSVDRGAPRLRPATDLLWAAPGVKSGINHERCRSSTAAGFGMPSGAACGNHVSPPPPSAPALSSIVTQDLASATAVIIRRVIGRAAMDVRCG